MNLISKRKTDENLKNHRNYLFYKELIDFIDDNNVKVIWTKGHDKGQNKTDYHQKIFSILDKAVRKYSRDLVN